MAATLAMPRALRTVVLQTGSAPGKLFIKERPIHSSSKLRSVAHNCQPRLFTTSAARFKKGGKHKGGPTTTDGSAASPTKDNPYDFSSLDKGIVEAQERLKEELRNLRPGGRLNTDVLENLKVRLDKESNELTRLGDLAQFVPRGRTVNIMVGEESHKKPITSAIQASDLGLQPQPDPTNPLQLNITMPGATAESRKESIAAAGKAEQSAIKSVREARQAQHKKHNSMKTAKTALPDDLKKAGGKMEKAVEAGLLEVKKIAEAAKRALESS